MTAVNRPGVHKKPLIGLVGNLAVMSVHLSLVLVLASFAFSSLANAQVAAFLVRHADRLDWSEDTALSKAGEERAQRLAALLKDAGITAIYATEYQRTQKTAEPLAQMLNIRPIIFSHADHAGPVNRVRRQNQKEVALIVGHDSSIPPMLKLLGHPEPITIAPTEYDNLFVLIPKENSRPTVIRLRY
jgi:phosphohistidine phosphatase SixA